MPDIARAADFRCVAPQKPGEVQGEEMNMTAIFSVFCVFIAAPTIVFGFIYLNKRTKSRVEELVLKREILELEMKKETVHMEVIREENRKYDRLINSRIETSSKN
jgi:hypothetical protein